ncbi:MAG: ABC transporter permease, partial [Gammaproteobacteria bacterium]|nr:ABC transporter permease [Gammaproteobacteria bacterium]
MIKPVILWTDVLIFMLTAVVVMFIFYARSKPHIRAPWRRVFTGKVAAASVVVLLAFVLVGLLDSLHYRLPLAANGDSDEVHYAGEVLSALDTLVGPLRTQVEKTYSAPFATQLFAKETIEQSDGSKLRDYPRLIYGGRHLGDAVDGRPGDILQRSLLAMVETLLAATLMLLLMAYWLARR